MQSRVRFPVSSTSSHEGLGDLHDPTRKNALQERLKHIMLLELKENGGREYHNMTLRGLVSSFIYNNRFKLDICSNLSGADTH
jgi:hypothetical protein